MKILAIETSCDETACAIVEDGRTVISSVIASQIDIHAATGGVVPEVAAREHVLKIVPVIEECLNKAKLGKDDLEAIAVTRGPGLLSSLIIGYSAAVTLSKAWKKTLIPVHHVSGHIYANWLDQIDPIEFPIIVLTVSGGHNDLVLMKDDCKFELIGETLDDAAGEAYDKVARLLGLGYPGGPMIAKAALKGNSKVYELPRAMLKSKDYNFSFSGLKTAVLQLIEKEHQEKGEITETFRNDLAASFQLCVNDILSEKLLKAAEQLGVKEVHLAGGVSANQALRDLVEIKMKTRKINRRLRYNKTLHYCTDNAAMIGAAAYYFYKQNPQDYSAENVIIKSPEPQLNLF